MSYKAKVISAKDIIKHPNADNLNILRYNGEQFVVGKDIKVGDTVILFPSDGQLSHNFCSANNLYRHAELNVDKLKTGFFEDGRRVRAQPFRGQKSYGFVCTPESLKYLGNVVLNVGDEFDTLNGELVCEKYYTEKTRNAMLKNQQKKIKEIEYTMKEHIDTEQWAYAKPSELPEQSMVIITEKIHGTSARTSFTKVIHKNLNFLSKIKSWFQGNGFVNEYSNYEYVSGTRHTVVNNRLDVTTVGQADYYRWEYHNKIAPQLHKGETVYYEIVGWDSVGGTIMERQDLSKIKDKSLLNPNWNKSMTYSYGLPENQNDVYVYRITMTSDDGTITELSWYQVEQRCRELGLKTVPVLRRWSEENIVIIETVVEDYVDNRSSTLDGRHLMEGVVIRIENSSGMKVYKSKNFTFKILEGILKENNEYIDNEEIN